MRKRAEAAAARAKSGKAHKHAEQVAHGSTWTRPALLDLAGAIRDHGRDPWFIALLYAAIDATHDPAEAVGYALDALEEHPTSPADGVSDGALISQYGKAAFSF